MRAHVRVALLATVVCVAATASRAQVVTAAPEPIKDVKNEWLTDVTLSLGMAQSYFTQNWFGDEIGSVAWRAGIDALAAKQLTRNFKLEQTLVLAFGQTHQQDASRSFWLTPIKSNDKIDYDAFGRLTLGRWLDPYLALTLDSQFYENRPAFGRHVLNPMQIGELAGVSHTYYDDKFHNLVWRTGFGLRQTAQRFYGEDPSVHKEVSNDGGFEFRTVGRWKDHTERTEFKTDFYVFQAVFFSESDFDSNNRWKQADVRWQNTFTTKVYKALTVGLYLDYFYDAQVRRAGQFKQTLGLGLSYDLL